MKKRRVSVVVLGDIGRSPRMQYHSISLVNLGYRVDVVGYAGSEPHAFLKISPDVTIKNIVPFPALNVPKIFFYILKSMWQSVTLFFALISNFSHCIIVQNPPAVPALLICWVVSFVTRAKLVVDWHNYAHTIMALGVGQKHKFTTLTEILEFFIGRRAHVNFCVTKAMQDDLAKKHITATVLYDRPPVQFHSITLEKQHQLFKKLAKRYEAFNCTNNETVFTERTTMGNAVLKKKRPGLLISSTSWTEDEDFSILLTALQNYEQSCREGNINRLPHLICVITGKGPLREHYTQIIAEKSWKHVTVITPWLEPTEYPMLLASADLGVCLHTSSSGLDLPMKVVDMFGCSLPVCAYDYDCLQELVLHNKNGFTFKTASQLAIQIQEWFCDFPNNKKQKTVSEQFKEEISKFQSLRWEENWNQVAKPILKSM